MKPSTISIQDTFLSHLRSIITDQTNSLANQWSSPQMMESFDFQPADIERHLPRFTIRPVIAGEVDNTFLDHIGPFHATFGAFDLNEKNPQISCHMIGKMFWNAEMKTELVSIRFRFNLFSAHKTNAYITYL